MALTLVSASASASASSCASSYSYNVFINHRGSDVKKTFASHLYRRLLSRGFRVFFDKPELQRGEKIDRQIGEAIATASVHVAIFSSGYAQSRWCLDELVLMLKSMESGAATIIPVFYNVKPSDLRWTDKGKNNDTVYPEALRILRQTDRYRVFVYALRILRWTGKESVYVQALRNLRWTRSDRGYAEALLNHEKKGRYSQERVAAWRKALSDVSYISGFELEACNGLVLFPILCISLTLHAVLVVLLMTSDEGELVDEVVRQVKKKAGKAPLHVATHPTGLDEKLQHFERTVLWEQQHNRGEPNVVGIVGLGGVGKTTLAKFFFNTKRSDYQQSCFLNEVRDAAARCRLPSLQSKLYNELTGGDEVMDNVDEGIATLKDRLSCRQALIVLDDVDDAAQLGALFSPLKDVLRSDSLILLTSRNQEVLRKSAGIDESSIYIMTCLDLEHSEQLFCSYAFHNPYPPVEYEDLVGEFLNACQGLPLSLKVNGALLYSESLEYWEEQLCKLSQVLPTEIQSRLKISYDSLDKQEKEIFLDITCLFIGMKRDTAITLWDGSGWKGSLGLRTLESKCLVTFDEENCISMHDYLRDLGRDLAELPGCPRRLWRPTDSLYRNGPTLSTVRGISIIKERFGKSFRSPSEFSDRIIDMSRLQLLRAPGDCLESLFNVIRHPELLWLRCEIDSSLSLPSWIQINKSDSCLPSWIPIKNLRVLELVETGYGPLSVAEMIPILGTLWKTESEAPLQLRELKITFGIFQLPRSIGKLTYLQKIELHYFKGTLPEEFFHLCSLKHLKLRAGMKSLPESLGNFTNLHHIDLSGCKDLQTLPSSFGNLAKLQHIDLSECWDLQTLPPSIGNLTNLHHIYLSSCKDLQTLPPSIGNLTELQHIDLSWCKGLQTLPPSIGNLTKLQHIDLSRCENLQTLPPSFGNLMNLQHVKLKGCAALKTLPDSMKLIRLKHLDLSSCRNLALTVETLRNISTLERLNFSSCHKMKLLPPQVTQQQSLKELILDYTNLRELPNDVGDLSKLEILSISGHSLETLPHSLRKLTDLKKLTVHLRKLKYLPDSIGELKQLTSLSISSPIREVPFASVEKFQGGDRLLACSINNCMPRLKLLNLWKTKITEISFAEGVCPVLGKLVLRGCDYLVELGALPTTLTSLILTRCCALKKIKGLHGLAKLRSLEISRCKQIEVLPAVGLRELDNLRELNLQNCPISVLPFASVNNVQGVRRLDSSIDKCMPLLKSLNLSETKITEISFGGGVSPVLQSLDLEGCDDLVEVGALPTTLTSLNLSDCCALKKISGLRGLAKLQDMEMTGCYAVEELPGLETLISLEVLSISECENMKRILLMAEAANPDSDVLKRVIQLIERSWWEI